MLSFAHVDSYMVQRDVFFSSDDPYSSGVWRAWIVIKLHVFRKDPARAALSRVLAISSIAGHKCYLIIQIHSGFFNLITNPSDPAKKG